MKKLAAVVVSIGVILVIVGLVIVGICGGDAIKNVNWQDIFNGTTHDIESAQMSIDKTSEELQGLESIVISADRYSVYVLPTKSDVVSVKYVEVEKDVRINVTSGDRVLVITESDKLSTHFTSSMFNRNRFIVVYVPQTEMFTNAKMDVTALTAAISVKNVTLSSLTCETRTGSVSLSGSDVGKIKLKTDTGSVTVDHVSCNRVEAVTDTGSVKINDTIATDNITVNAETGSVNCNVTTNYLTVKVDTGSVGFYAKANDIDITTDTGSVNGKVVGNKDDYSISVRKDTGKSNISNQSVNNATRFLKVKVDTGSINIDFIKD